MKKMFFGTRLAVASAGVCAFFLASCTKPAPDARELARVNDRPLTREMIEARSEHPAELTEAQIQMYASRWVVSELLYQEAKRQGLDQSEAVRRSLEDAEKQLAVAALLEKEVISIAPEAVPAERVQAYYEKHQDEFSAHEPTVWLQTAVFRDRRSGERFRDLALSDAGWASAVSTLKAEGKLSVAADSMLHTQSTLYPNELWRVASAMRTHDVSFPVKTSGGFFVMRLLGSLKRGETMPLPVVEPKIRERLSVELRQEKYNELVESLRKKNNVQLFVTGGDSLSRSGE
ncbi:MAG: peptidyl-prolyl cis-trans isomerase [Acidobacteriota bacterium]